MNIRKIDDPNDEAMCPVFIGELENQNLIESQRSLRSQRCLLRTTRKNKTIQDLPQSRQFLMDPWLENLIQVGSVQIL